MSPMHSRTPLICCQRFKCLFIIVPLSNGVYREEVTGIEGILSCLEKERSSAFGVSIQEGEMLDHFLNDNGENDRGTLPYGSPSNTVCYMLIFL